MKNAIISLVIILVLIFLGMKIFKGNDSVKNTEENTTIEQVSTTSDMVKVEGDSFEVDTTKSVVSWKGAFVSGAKSHTGTIALMSGEGKIQNGMVSSLKVVFDMNSIKDVDNNDRLITHLKSADFFDVAKFPQSSFEMTKINKPITDGEKDDYMVYGNLTIRNITKEIGFPVKIVKTPDGSLNATGKLTFNRADFEVKYGSSSFFKNLGDKVIKDEVEITLNLFSKPISIPSSI